MVDIKSQIKDMLLALSVEAQEGNLTEEGVCTYTKKIVEVFEEYCQDRDALPRYYLSGVDNHGYQYFINSELTPEKARKKAKEILKAYPNRYERVYIETADKKFQEWVVKDEDKDKWKQLITKF